MMILMINNINFNKNNFKENHKLNLKVKLLLKIIDMEVHRCLDLDKINIIIII